MGKDGCLGGVLFGFLMTSGTGLPARRDKTPAKRGLLGSGRGRFGDTAGDEAGGGFGDFGRFGVVMILGSLCNLLFNIDYLLLFY